MKYYYGLINGSYGFVDEEDSRHTREGLIELTQEEHQQLLNEQSQGKEIVCYEGKVFTSEPGLYYLDDNKNWRKKDDEAFEREKLENAKAVKYAEACTKAYSYLNDGEGLYEIETGKHIEATDGNISKLTSYMLELAQKEAFYGAKDDITVILENVINMFNGKIHGETVEWSTNEDEVLNLNVVQIVKVLKGLAKIQSGVWCGKFKEYKELIEQAQTVEEVKGIVINYGKEEK